jgi:hypothetical protein
MRAGCATPSAQSFNHTFTLGIVYLSSYSYSYPKLLSFKPLTRTGPDDPALVRTNPESGDIPQISNTCRCGDDQNKHFSSPAEHPVGLRLWLFDSGGHHPTLRCVFCMYGLCAGCHVPRLGLSVRELLWWCVASISFATASVAGSLMELLLFLSTSLRRVVALAAKSL